MGAFGDRAEGIMYCTKFPKFEHSLDPNSGNTDFHQVPDKTDLLDFVQMDKTMLPAFLQMVADLIPGITSFQLDFSMDSLLPLLLITSLNVLLVALLLGRRSAAEVVLHQEC